MLKRLEAAKIVETEYKFVILNFNPELIPRGAERFLITQDYLISGEGGLRRRVRIKRNLRDGMETYYYAEKRKTGVPGKRYEAELKISFEEYQQFLQCERDPGLQRIVKERTERRYAGHVLEYDTYSQPEYVGWLRVLEIEVPDFSVEVEPPPELELFDVTRLPGFSNRSIAKGSLKGKTLEDVRAMR